MEYPYYPVEYSYYPVEYPYHACGISMYGLSAPSNWSQNGKTRNLSTGDLFPDVTTCSRKDVANPPHYALHSRFCIICLARWGGIRHPSSKYVEEPDREWLLDSVSGAQSPVNCALRPSLKNRDQLQQKDSSWVSVSNQGGAEGRMGWGPSRP